MTITIHPPISVPGCEQRSLLYTVVVNGDEASVRVWPDGGWQLLRAEGDADRIEDWTFITAVR